MLKGWIVSGLAVAGLLLLSVAGGGCQNKNGGGHGGMMKMGHGMSAADNPPASHITFLPDQIQWQAGPPGLPPGGHSAVLEGDPSKPGFFTIRAWLPDGYRVPPHFHPATERVTVLTGTLYLGEGDRFDPGVATPLTVGAYTAMPAGMHHFAFAKGPTVIQISTIGPWGITYINPADDPRKQMAPSR